MNLSARALPKPMTEFNAPQPTPEVPSSVPEPLVAPAPPDKPALIAPLWHTLLVAALILGNSFLGSAKVGAVHGQGSRILLYGGTFVTQLVLFIIIWFGLRSRGIRMRDLIGGRWEKVEDFLLDLGLAIGFMLVAGFILLGLRIALGTVDLHNLEKVKNDAKQMLGPIAPHTYLEAGLFVLLSVCAGLFEEIIFRGYFQRQFHALSRSAAIGIIISGIIFGLAHGYQGGRMMVVIAVFGMFFGILAYVRKSLRPGMMAHAIQDSYSGIVLFFLMRH